MSFIQHTYAKKLAQRQSAQNHARYFVNMEPTVYFSRWSIPAVRCVISCPSWPTALRAQHSIGDIGVTRLYVRPKGVWAGSAREDVGWHEIEICWMILPGIELQTELEMMDMFPALESSMNGQVWLNWKKRNERNRGISHGAGLVSLIFVREMYPHRITKWWLAGSDSKEQGVI